jgi:hypothetical protein
MVKAVHGGTMICRTQPVKSSGIGAKHGKKSSITAREVAGLNTA